MEKFYSCAEIAERYQVQTVTVWDWIRQQKLPAIRVGKRYRIKESDLLEFEKSNRTVQDSGG